MVRRIEDMFPQDLAEHIRSTPIVVLPLGTVEWHSDHLPLGLDGLVAAAIAEQIAERLDAVIVPTSYFAAGGVPYPFTLKFPMALIEPMFESAFEQFGAMGFRVVVAFTGHFGLEQTLAFKRAAVNVMRRSSTVVLPLTAYDLVTETYQGDHASIGETSLMWAIRPELVRLAQIPDSASLEGVLGPDPRGKASEAWGRELFDSIVERAAAVARRFTENTPAVERSHFIEALSAAVRVLEETYERRLRLPKSQVPPVTTLEYLAHCQALYRGDYRAAKQHAERKLAALES